MMRKFLIGVLAGVALAIPASAQSVREAVYADPARAGGVYYMMPVTAYSVTAPPKGYEPVYLSHYGRHGARYLLNDTQYERSLGVLRAAHDEDALTELDERLWQEASAYFEETCRFRAGDLTPLGWEQHYRIAQEIYKANRKFFRKKPVITAVIRLTAAASLDGPRNGKGSVSQVISRTFLPPASPCNLHGFFVLISISEYPSILFFNIIRQ